jgi:succinyldiaminopimelate transaminase
MSYAGFVPPPYPYDRLDEMKPLADAHEGGCVDLSIGTPCDPPPAAVVAALANSNAERGYPASIGSLGYRRAAAAWLQRRFDIAADPAFVGACVGTKEFVALLPQLLHLRSPERDTILYPAISYPTYAMGATLGGLRAVAVPVDSHWRIDLSRIKESDARRALALWVNTPGNPAGGLDDLDAAAEWGRARSIPVFSDECYIEFTWDGPGRSILRTGTNGVVAVHSLSKRSNLAGGRAGFYTGDPELVHYLQEVRKHAGLMVPGPIQAAAVAAFGDDAHVEQQRGRYHRRLQMAQQLLAAFDVEVPLPAGGFYLWAPAPDGDAWGLTRRLATEAGVLVSPGEFYGEGGAGYIRVAVVQPDEALALAARRVGVCLD